MISPVKAQKTVDTDVRRIIRDKQSRFGDDGRKASGNLQCEHPQQPWRELSCLSDVHSVRPLEEQVG
jgi:hypothetical protein